MRIPGPKLDDRSSLWDTIKWRRNSATATSKSHKTTLVKTQNKPTTMSLHTRALSRRDAFNAHTIEIHSKQTSNSFNLAKQWVPSNGWGQDGHAYWSTDSTAQHGTNSSLHLFSSVSVTLLIACRPHTCDGRTDDVWTHGHSLIGRWKDQTKLFPVPLRSSRWHKNTDTEAVKNVVASERGVS